MNISFYLTFLEKRIHEIELSVVIHVIKTGVTHDIIHITGYTSTVNRINLYNELLYNRNFVNTKYIEKCIASNNSASSQRQRHATR